MKKNDVIVVNLRLFTVFTLLFFILFNGSLSAGYHLTPHWIYIFCAQVFGDIILLSLTVYQFIACAKALVCLKENHYRYVFGLKFFVRAPKTRA